MLTRARRTVGKCGVICTAMLLFCMATPVHAGYFCTAALDLSTSNYHKAFASYYSFLALWIYSQGGDGTGYAYQAYGEMNLAASYAYEAWQQCINGYQLDSSDINTYAINYTYYTYIFESNTADDLWYISQQDVDYIGDAIAYGYVGGFYSSYAAFWVGMACNGGVD